MASSSARRNDGAVARALLAVASALLLDDPVLLGVDEVLAERGPADKVGAVAAEQAIGPTMMVGDGINDAPALARADVGVAMGAGGGSASTEAADAVLTVDRLERLGDAMAIARRSSRIARRARSSASACRRSSWRSPVWDSWPPWPEPSSRKGSTSR